MQQALFRDCGGPYDLEPDHTISCWETEALSPAEATILNYLMATPSLVAGKRLFHVGIGNRELPRAMQALVHDYVGITISKPELDLFDEEFAATGNMLGFLMNKYDHRQFDLIKGEFDIIVDTLLKSVTCCEKHFDDMMGFFVNKLASKGRILTTRNGINFGWSGDRTRAFTPGSQTEPAVRTSRILGEKGLDQVLRRFGMTVTLGPIGATGDVVLTLSR